MISKWRWRPAADREKLEEWKLQRVSLGLRPVDASGTWPGRPRSGSAGVGGVSGLTSPGLAENQAFWEKHTPPGLCYGCGGDWQFKGALKVDIDSSEYTGYRYYFKKPGYRIKSRSCEDARFIHINFVLLAEVKHFEKVSDFFCSFAYLYLFILLIFSSRGSVKKIIKINFYSA